MFWSGFIHKLKAVEVLALFSFLVCFQQPCTGQDLKKSVIL